MIPLQKMNGLAAAQVFVQQLLMNKEGECEEGMAMNGAPKPKVDTVRILNGIEREVYKAVKCHGFTKHGRTLHRFVSEDISQVINFQVGQSYLGDTHLMAVNIGIRVPECVLVGYRKGDNQKKYYGEAECNLRSGLGCVEGKKETCYDLRKPADQIIGDILRQIENKVIPAFDVLCSREAILEQRRNYPQFDQMNNHLILREEAMIYKYCGDEDRAVQQYNAYLSELTEKAERLIEGEGQSSGNVITGQGWLKYALELAGKLNIPVLPETQERVNAFCKLSALEFPQ